MTALPARPVSPAKATLLPALLPRWGWWVLAVLLAGGSAMSVAAWRSTQAAELEAARLRFERNADDAAEDLRQRLDAAQRLLRSAAALFAATRTLGGDDWKAFADLQDLPANYPGLIGLAFAPLHDRGPTAPPVAPVLWREPMDDAARAVIGRDLLADPVRREALLRARDSGLPALSATTTPLSTPAPRPGAATDVAVLYAPVYTPRHPLQTEAQRRAALHGWVMAPVNVGTLMQQLVRQRGGEAHVVLWDGPAGTAGHRSFESRAAEVAAAGPGWTPRLRSERLLDVGGRRWTLQLSSLPHCAAGDSGRAMQVLAGGLALTLLMTLFVGTLMALRGRALALARRLSAAYRASEAQVRTVLDNAAEGILTLDDEGRVCTANPSARRLLGLPADGAVVRALQSVLPIDPALLREPAAAHADAPHGGWRSEVQLGERTLLVSASRPSDDARGSQVLMLSDVTELERARSVAYEAGAFNETILANAPFCIIVTDEQGRLRSINPAGERMLGYGRGELLGCDSVPLLHLESELAPLAARLSAELGRELSPKQALGALARRGECGALECHYVRKDGTAVPIVLALAPLPRPDGEIAGYVGIACDITERKRSEAYIRHMAHHDELTGLPNRTLLQERAALAIDSARQRGGKLAVMLIDLDRFKQINDSLGHHAGDVVLCAVAARLMHCLRTSDTVARMGGDEFVILLPDVDGTPQAEHVAAKLLQAMVEPVQAGPHRLAVTPSIGIACFPEDGEDLSTLLRNADTAMYACKNTGRNHYTLYTPQMHSASALRLALEGELRLALERDELRLHYQPLVRLADGEVVGVEALLRWNHPLRGAVSPADFIPIAEDTGLIVPIGEWVLRTACADMQHLLQATGRRLKVAVNLSPRQLRAANLNAVIADALASAGWPADLLELEITESMVIDNPDASVAAMQRLRAMGVGLAIDDFGTGYSSLSYLSRFPVAQLKIDRSFVRGLPDNEREAAIATAVVAMGHGLKLQVLAEGIETEAQRRFLQGLGCDLGQGWLFAKPMPLQALVAQLQAGHGEAAPPPQAQAQLEPLAT